MDMGGVTAGESDAETAAKAEGGRSAGSLAKAGVTVTAAVSEAGGAERVPGPSTQEDCWAPDQEGEQEVS